MSARRNDLRKKKRFNDVNLFDTNFFNAYSLINSKLNFLIFYLNSHIHKDIIWFGIDLNIKLNKRQHTRHWN